jgi:aminoglycoside phosphotransferase family enzyme/predicted kinase
MPCQDAIFEFMANPASYRPRPERVERIDTHAAVVFLAGGEAYKIKRAVRLAYLDFSTLEKRRAICARELEINRATAPDLYIGLVPITKQGDGGLEIDGRGDVVEWAIRMRRFDQANLFDALASRNALPLDLMVLLAAAIAELHGRARRKRVQCGAAVFGHVVKSVISSLNTSAPHLPESEVNAWRGSLSAAFRDARPSLDARAREGYVRRCHGDLHLRNIVLLDGRPVLFDAIEFDEEIATVDILYDLAFLLMDLWHRGLKTHANTVFNVWARRAEAGPPIKSLAGLAVLPLFLSLRAGVRAMVTLDRLGVVNEGEKKMAIAELREFFDLSRNFLERRKPQMLVVGGLSGTGKSTLAAGLAPEIGNAPGALIVRSDVERKRLAGVGETCRLGPAHYTPAATGRVYAALCAKAQAAIRAGHSVVLDAVYARQGQRARVESLAERLGVTFAGIWLEAAERELVDRVKARKGDASDADAAVVRKQFDYDTGHMTWHVVDASGSPDTVLKRARSVLGLA